MTALALRRALLDYVRRPLNLVLLVAVPVVIVVVWGGSLADFSKLLRATARPAHLEAAAAGWAAALLAGLAGFFQVFGSRAADRRLASAAGRAGPVVAGRLGASTALAGLAAAGALVALAAKTGIADPPRAIAATLLVAFIYLALGVLVGTLVRSEMNGALIVTMVWVFDAFLGPGLGTGSVFLTRLFPLHFPTYVLIDQSSGHAGPIGDLGWSLAWVLGLSALAVARLTVTTHPAHSKRPALVTNTPVPAPASVAALALTVTAPPPPPVATSHPAPAAFRASPAPSAVTEATRPVSAPRIAIARAPASVRLAAGLRAGLREYRRNRVLWALLIVVPILFIALAAAVTPAKLGPVALVDGAHHLTAMLSLKRVHVVEMAAVASAFLAGITGLFVVTGSAGGDQRLVLSGFRPREVLAGHLGVIVGASVVTTAVALGMSAIWLSPLQWATLAAADLMIALTYAMVGVLLGPLVGRLGGLYLVLLLAFIDVGYGQTVMFSPVPPAWGALLPARGASKLMINGAFTAHFGQTSYLLLGLAWLAALSVAAVVAFGRQADSKAS